MLIETIIQSPDLLSFLGGAVMLDEDGFAAARTAASEVGAAKILAIAQEVLR